MAWRPEALGRLVPEEQRKLPGVCGHDLEAGARQRLDNALCNSLGFVGIHPFVGMVSTGFAYRGGNYRIYLVRIGHGSLNLAGA